MTNFNDFISAFIISWLSAVIVGLLIYGLFTIFNRMK